MYTIRNIVIRSPVIPIANKILATTHIQYFVIKLRTTVDVYKRQDYGLTARQAEVLITVLNYLQKNDFVGIRETMGSLDRHRRRLFQTGWQPF